MRLNKEIRLIIKKAIIEDIGREDITTLFTIPCHYKIEAIIIAKEKGILCGLDIAEAIFKERSKNIFFKPLKQEGSKFKKNDKIVYIKGDARAILSGERVALNFLSLLSGVATATRNFVDKIKGTKAKILDTRKTTPNLRILEKYAVRVGGGVNHRKRLDTAVLIKDNHLRAGKFLTNGKIDEKRLSKCILHLKKIYSLKVEIEVETFEEFLSVIKYKPTVVMLDNFSLKQMRQATNYRDKYYPSVKLEASGGINLKNVHKIAKTGVDFISIGSITHSPKAIDFSLEVLSK
ncbi:MAG: carboxylating nicotinate-nucleotide diphosphorylase [Candidatus Omnitrophica bacterium]|nr:carboxylating nicotinate-nucleotide diphosphorylase [Candidatus Omnitrophota bacterium]